MNERTRLSKIHPPPVNACSTPASCIECQSSSAALRRAEVLSRAAGSIGAVAFSRTGDPMIGEFGDAQLLKKFGNVPDDLGGL